MAILLNFIISEGDLLDVNPLPMVNRQSGKYEICTGPVHSWSVTVFVAAVRQLQLEIKDESAREIGRKKSTQKLIAKRFLGIFTCGEASRSISDAFLLLLTLLLDNS